MGFGNFIKYTIELFKIVLVKNIEQEIDCRHLNLIEELRNGDYLPFEKYINTGNTIFSYCLLFF